MLPEDVASKHGKTIGRIKEAQEVKTNGGDEEASSHTDLFLAKVQSQSS